MFTKVMPTRRMCASLLAASLLLAGLFSVLTVPAAGAGINIAQGTLLDSGKTAEISTAELQQIFMEKSATVFDARSFNEFAIGHIPGALTVAAKPGVTPAQHVSDVAEVGRMVAGKEAPIVLYCNGPFGVTSKRLGEQLLEAGYTNVRRYQLGIPTWRTLVGPTQIELEGLRYVQGDNTVLFFDARTPWQFNAGSLPGARNLTLAEVTKDSGWLPMWDHNTRIIVFGKDGEQARAVADALAQRAFDNVSFYAASLDSLIMPLATIEDHVHDPLLPNGVAVAP